MRSDKKKHLGGVVVGGEDIIGKEIRWCYGSSIKGEAPEEKLKRGEILAFSLSTRKDFYELLVFCPDDKQLYTVATNHHVELVEPIQPRGAGAKPGASILG